MTKRQTNRLSLQQNTKKVDTNRNIRYQYITNFRTKKFAVL